MSRPSVFPHQNSVNISLPPVSATCPDFLIFLDLMTRAMAKSTNHEVPDDAFFFSLLLFAVIVQLCTINFNHIRGGSRSLPGGPHGALTGYDAAVRRYVGERVGALRINVVSIAATERCLFWNWQNAFMASAFCDRCSCCDLEKSAVFFDYLTLEREDITLLWNIGNHSSNDAASDGRRREFSITALWKPQNSHHQYS